MKSRKFVFGIILIISGIVVSNLLLLEANAIEYRYEIFSKTLVKDVPFSVNLKIINTVDIENLEHVLLKFKIMDIEKKSEFSLGWYNMENGTDSETEFNQFVNDVNINQLENGNFIFTFTPKTNGELISLSVDVLEKQNELLTYSIQKMTSEELTIFPTIDPVTQHGIERSNNQFNVYKKEQSEIAAETLELITGFRNIQNPDFSKNSNSITNYTYLARSENQNLQNAILLEMERASKLFEQLYHIGYNFNE